VTTRPGSAAQSGGDGVLGKGRAPRPGNEPGAPAPSGAGAPGRRNNRPHLEDVLAGRSRHGLEELCRFWGGARAPGDNGAALDDGAPDALRRALLGWMSSPEQVEERLGAIGKRQNQILQVCLRSKGYRASLAELAEQRSLGHLSRYDLEAAVSMLERHGLLVQWEDPRFEHHGRPVYAVPVEIGDGMLRQQRLRRRGVFDVFTLRGFLDRLNEDPARERRIAPTRLRVM
jgi:hypothetical protein